MRKTIETRQKNSYKMEEKSLQQAIFKYSICLAISSFIGFLLSSYAVYVEHKIEENEDYQAMCDISEKISCTKVFSSSYGKGFGILGNIFGENSLLNQPNGYLGIGFYGFLIFSSFIHNKAVVRLQFFLSILSVILSGYLAYLLYFILEDLCIVCLGTYLTNFINLAMTWKKLSVLKERNFYGTKKYTTKKLN